MDIVKRHLFFILCGVGGIAGVALAFTGLGAMPAVLEEMEVAQQLYDDLTRLRSKGVNQRILDHAGESISRILGDHDAIVAQAADLYGYEPLVLAAFPEGDASARRKFRSVYGEAMRKLMESLRAGGPATVGDIETMRSKIENEEFRRRRLQGEEATPDSGPFFTLAGVLTAAGARRDPNARAHIAAAQRIYLYAIGFEGGIPGETEPSLMFEHTLEDISTVDAPELEEIWQAQVNYWIQKDVVEAIVAINAQAAAEAKKRNEDRWVGIMPVKDFISLRMSDGYVEPSEDDYAGASPGGYKPALPAASPNTVFTHSASTDFYDVMQFTLKLVMDQRDVPRLIERLCANSFHTPLRFAYEAVMPNRAMKGKVYGAEPSVNVVMDFEIVMLGEIFRKWMPAVVCEEYGIRCPIRDDAEADTEEG